MIAPNTDRVLIKLLKRTNTESSVIVPGQLKAGENLFFGEIVHGGDTKFKKGQKVWYSEYSAAAIFLKMEEYLQGEVDFGELAGVKKEDEQYFVVAEDDIMAYIEEEKTATPLSVPTTPGNASPKA